MKTMIDLYSDYLLSSSGQTSAKGMSELLSGVIMHDKVTQFLKKQEFGSKELWLMTKTLVRQHESTDGCLVFDDTIIEKAYMGENDLICWHYDHSKKRNIKGINLLTGFYVSSKDDTSEPLRIPIGYALILKTILYFDEKAKKNNRKSETTKNDLMLGLLDQAISNQLKFKYVLADSWFASAKNMRHIHQKKKIFIFDLPINRKAVKSDAARNNGQWTRIDELDLATDTPTKVWLKDLEIPLLLCKQVFTNKDNSLGVRYLVSNDLDLSIEQFATIYKKRWSVEEFHKSIKQNACVAKCPARSISSQSNHLFLSLWAYVKLEKLKFANALNHFALKSKLYHVALKAAFKELRFLNSKFQVA